MVLETLKAQTLSNAKTSTAKTSTAKTGSARASTTKSDTATTVVAAADEVERMMRNLCAYALSEPDPLRRFHDLTHQQAVFEGVAAALQRERGNALADLAELGVPLLRIVEGTRLASAQQVRNLVKAAGRTLPTARNSAAKKAAPKKAAPSRAELPLIGADSRGSRMLTAAERKALGLPPLKPVGRRAGRPAIPRQRVAS